MIRALYRVERCDHTAECTVRWPPRGVRGSLTWASCRLSGMFRDPPHLLGLTPEMCMYVCDDYECVSVSAAVVETLAGWLIRRRRRGGVGILSGSTTETDTF